MPGFRFLSIPARSTLTHIRGQKVGALPDVPRDSLPPVLEDHAQTALGAARSAGAMELRSGRLSVEWLRVWLKVPSWRKPETEAEDRLEREQEALVAANAGKVIGAADGPFADLVIAARRAVAWRKRKQTESA